MSERIMVYAIVYDRDGREVLRTAEYLTLQDCWDFVVNSTLPPAPRKTVFLTSGQQRGMDSALRDSLRIIA